MQVLCSLSPSVTNWGTRCSSAASNRPQSLQQDRRWSQYARASQLVHQLRALGEEERRGDPQIQRWGSQCSSAASTSRNFSSRRGGGASMQVLHSLMHPVQPSLKMIAGPQLQFKLAQCSLCSKHCALHCTLYWSLCTVCTVQTPTERTSPLSDSPPVLSCFLKV